MKRNIKNSSGSALLIYLLVMSIILTLPLAGTYSRLLLAISRGQSATDILASSYQAETEVNDVLARLSGGFISDSSFPFSFSRSIGDTNIDISAQKIDGKQVVNATVGRFFASTKVVAERKLDTIKDVENVDLILALDCTGSMNAGANCENCFESPTRFNAQEDAAVNFIDKLLTLPDRNKFRVGVMSFGIDHKWINSGGRDITPDNNLPLSEIRSAVINGFGNTRAESTACSGIMDATSVGTAFAQSGKYFSENEKPKTKQVMVVVTDGDPNSRIPFPGCNPSSFCPAFPLDPDGTNYCENNPNGWSCHQYSQYRDSFSPNGFNERAYNICRPLGVEFLRCSVAEAGEPLPGGGVGVRNPNIDAYAVTIFSKPPSEVVSLFNTYLGGDKYFNASRATQLTQLLNTILNEIVSDREVVTIRRELPN